MLETYAIAKRVGLGVNIFGCFSKLGKKIVLSLGKYVILNQGEDSRREICYIYVRKNNACRRKGRN
jgi:hypothetical protein